MLQNFFTLHTTAAPPPSLAHKLTLTPLYTTFHSSQMNVTVWPTWRGLVGKVGRCRVGVGWGCWGLVQVTLCSCSLLSGHWLTAHCCSVGAGASHSLLSPHIRGRESEQTPGKGGEGQGRPLVSRYSSSVHCLMSCLPISVSM